MRARLRAAAGVLTSVLVVSTSCGDGSQSTAPGLTSARSPARSLAGLLSVSRATPLAHDVTWSFTAGPTGATSANSNVGLTVTVPAGALSNAVTITVTALAGSAAAYRFEPHLEFSKHVRLSQDASTLSLAGLLLPLWGGHFDGDTPELAGGLLSLTEQVPAMLSILTGKVEFDVSHFTGWILASGNGSPPDSTGSGSGQ